MRKYVIDNNCIGSYNVVQFRLYNIYTKKEYLETLFVHGIIKVVWFRGSLCTFVRIYIYKGKIKFIVATVGCEITANYCTIISTRDEHVQTFRRVQTFRSPPCLWYVHQRYYSWWRRVMSRVQNEI